MENLFEIRQMSINLDVLRESDRSYRFLLDTSLKINMDTKNVLESFYQKYIIIPDRMYQYVLSPEWGEATGNFRMRFIIVEVDNDFVLVPFKVIDHMLKEKDRYFYISLEPISYHNSTESILKVLDVLRTYDVIKFIVVSGDMDRDVYMNNFYNTIEEFNHMDRGKWKSKKGINILPGLIHTQIGYYNEFDVERVRIIDNMWNTQKRLEKKTTLPEKIDVNLAKMSSRYDDVLLYLFNYRDKTVGYSIGAITARKYVSILSSKSLVQVPDEVLYSYLEDYDVGEVELLRKYLGGYMQYIINKDILKDRSFEALYYYGDVHSESLNTFKMIYYKRVINSYRISLEEYIDSLNK